MTKHHRHTLFGTERHEKYLKQKIIRADWLKYII